MNKINSNRRRLNLHFFGSQGSGKGTQAEILADKLGLKLISVGKLLRERANQKDRFAIHLKKILNQGVLIPIGIFERVLEEAINEEKSAQGFVFDGAMRNIEELKVLSDIWPKLNLDDPWIIVLKISDDLTKERIINRLTCDNCGFITSIKFLVPSSKNCPKCQIGHLKKRSDDTIEAVEERLSIYHKETSQVIDYYQKKNRLIEIDGAPAVEIVEKLVFDTLIQRKVIKASDVSF